MLSRAHNAAELGKGGEQQSSLQSCGGKALHSPQLGACVSTITF